MDVVYFPRKQDIIIAVSRDKIGDHFREKRGGLLRNLLDKSSDKKNWKTKGLKAPAVRVAMFERSRRHTGQGSIERTRIGCGSMSQNGTFVRSTFFARSADVSFAGSFFDIHPLPPPA